MPVTNTDAVLHYDVGEFGELGYGVPNWSNDIGSLNPAILDLVNVIGRNLFHIMHHEDIDMRTPPSINTLRRVHKLYLRASQILTGRAIPPGELNLETQHVNPGGEVFRVYPIPYFRVRNVYLRRWAGYSMMALSEAMQHTENRKAVEISTGFAGQIGQYFTRIYQNMAVELFGKTREEVTEAGFVMAETDLAGYDPSQYFTSTELVDTVPDLSHVLTEDRLEVLAQGLPVTELPELRPWPLNLTDAYARLRNTPADGGTTSSSPGGFPPPPSP